MSSTGSTSSSQALSSPPNTPPSVIDAGATDNASSEAERFLMQQSNRLSILYALCIGLDEPLGDDGSTTPLMDLNATPFNLMKKKREIKPSLDILREEVKRRSELDVTCVNKPKPNGWNAKKCQEWLMVNPITTAQDVAFLIQRAKAVKQVVANATQKTVQSSPGDRQNEAELGNKWVGPLPYLRLIHCLMEDDVKEKYLHRNRRKTIQEIDARRSDVRPEDAYEMIAARWNSDEFNPVTMVSNCHYDFSEPIDIGFEATKEFTRANPTKIKDKLAKMRSDLTSIIHKWERSGQGDSGHMEDEEDDDEDNVDDAIDNDNDNETSSDANEVVEEIPSRQNFAWGRSEGRQGAFDRRESFLGPNPSYLLYLWDVLDSHDLFDTTINMMSDEAGASSADKVPGVLTNSSCSTGTDDVSLFLKGVKEVLLEATLDVTKAADRHHADDTKAADRRHEDNTKAADRRHKEVLEAEEKRVRMKSEAAENRLILQANLDHKKYLKRRIDTLQDEARRVRYKIFESMNNERSNEESFFRNELEVLQKEIKKCTEDLGNESEKE